MSGSVRQGLFSTSKCPSLSYNRASMMDRHTDLVLPTSRLVAAKGPRRGKQSPSDALFRQLADGAPLMLWTADAAGRLTFANRSWLSFAGRPLTRERGFGWTARIHPDDRSTFVTKQRSAVKSRRRFTLEYRYQRSDGQYRWISDRGLPLKDHRGRLTGYVGSRVDVTEHERSGRDPLAEAEARFRQIAENAQDIIYRYRFVPHRGTEYINAAAEALTGRTPEEFYADPNLALKCVHP